MSVVLHPRGLLGVRQKERKDKNVMNVVNKAERGM